MKIVSLTAENFLRLSAVSITPDGNLVQITGKNGEGKTSVLNVISSVLDWRNHGVKEPIHGGAEKGFGELDLGDIIVRRKFRKKGSETITELSVTNKEGAVFKSPQAVIDKLWNSLSIDPIEFANMDAREQFVKLQTFVPGVDFAQINLDHAADYSRRTELNKEAAQKMAQAEMIEVADGNPEALTVINEAELMNALEHAGKTNVELAQRKSNREAAAQKIMVLRSEAFTQIGCKDEVESIYQRALEDAKKKYEQACEEATRVRDLDLAARDSASAKATAEADALQTKLDAAPPLPEPVDPTYIRSQIDFAKKNNEVIAAFKRRQALVDASNSAALESAKLSERMEARQKAKADAIAAAKMPVPGLGFGEGFITYNGYPFENASDRDKLVVSLSIAMAQNPTLRVIRAKNGSLIDSAGIKVIEEMIGAQDYQLWLERMDESGQIGFVIEDGHLKTAEARETQ